MSQAWAKGSTRAWRRLRAQILIRDNHRCRLRIEGVCTTVATCVHHTEGKTHGDDPRYLVAACQPCNARVSDPAQVSDHQRVVTWVRAHAPTTIRATAAQFHDITRNNVATIIARARHRGELVRTARGVYDVGPTGLPPGVERSFGFPHRGGPSSPAVPVLSLPPEAGEGGLVVRADLSWDPARLADYAWLAPFLDVPDDASPPLAMSLPAEDATGSYGAEAVAWIEESQRITLRWWQALALTRQLEHRADGSLCHRVVVESAPRRAGKSVRVRGLVLWRMAHPDLFGETQTVIHTGSDVAICREIQRGAWRWAEEIAGWTVSRANGKEAVETPDGDRWLVRAQRAVYGYDACVGVVDEGWDVMPDTVSEGLEPATLERSSPQLHLTSTAHRRATSLMRTRLQVAMTAEDPDTLLLLWAAPNGADPGDPEVWRAASPHWSEDRRRMIADKYAKALAGEADPQADDPDPMAGFEAQYLNRWRLRPAKVERGDPAVSEEDWAALVVDRPEGPPAAAAVEAWFADGVALALAWRSGDEVVVSVRDLADLGQVRGALREAGFSGRAKVGASLLDDPALTGLRATKGQGRTGAAVAELRRLLDEGVFSHDGSELLTEQVLAARTTPGADGPRMVSTGAADAIKAAVWAAAACRRPSVGKPRLIVAG